jgi:hypothetical protein
MEGQSKEIIVSITKEMEGEPKEIVNQPKEIGSPKFFFNVYFVKEPSLNTS